MLALAATFWEACSSASVSSAVSHSPSAARPTVVSWGWMSRSPVERRGGAAGDEAERGDDGDARRSAPAADRRPEGDEEADDRISAAMTPNTAGPPVFDRNSMIRLNE